MNIGFQVVQKTESTKLSLPGPCTDQRKNISLDSAFCAEAVVINIPASKELVLFVSSVCPGKAESILSEDVLGNTASVAVLLYVAWTYLYYSDLKSVYEAKRLRQRVSQL